MTTGDGAAVMSRAKTRLMDLEKRIIGCRHCPGLVENREKIGREKQAKYRDWEYWAKPVTGFGDLQARLMVVGLAPAAHGGNRTGRSFTGDASAKVLIAALHQTGFANQPTSEHRDDGLLLQNVYISNAVRCVPPGNRPSVQEQRDCLPFLAEEFDILPKLTTVLALGGVAFMSCLRALSQKAPQPLKAKFGHGGWFHFGDYLPTLVASYHPSPLNINTGRFSIEALVDLLQEVRDNLEVAAPG